jgi:hypothetical protein
VPTGSEIVCLWEQIGSERRSVKRAQLTPTGHRLSCEPSKKAVSEVTPAYKSVMEEAEARDGLIRNRIFLAKRMGFENPAEPSDFPCVIGI